MPTAPHTPINHKLPETALQPPHLDSEVFVHQQVWALKVAVDDGRLAGVQEVLQRWGRGRVGRGQARNKTPHGQGRRRVQERRLLVLALLLLLALLLGGWVHRSG
jgi:hypothetical protein